MHAQALRLRPTHPARFGAAALALLLVSGCSILEEDRIDYRSAQRGNTLEVPPDLTQLSRDPRLQVPVSGSISARELGAATVTAGSAPVTALSSMGDVRIERAGNQRWLVVKRPPEALWSPVQEFWKQNGFNLDVAQEPLGIMETDWAENRAKLPQDAIRRTIGRLLDTLYDTGERDRFRTRLERNAQGETEIYISHRGMVEVYTSAQKEQTVWQPRPANTELEAEFLRRLMVSLGTAEEQARAALASAPPASAARATTVNNLPVVQMDEGFERAWRRVGLTLDRTGFTVEDRDRAQGLYFVRYVEPVAVKEEPGFFGRMFGASRKEATPVRYRIVLRSSSSSNTTVSVLDSQGQPDGSAAAQRIVQLLADDLK